MRPGPDGFVLVIEALVDGLVLVVETLVHIGFEAVDALVLGVEAIIEALGRGCPLSWASRRWLMGSSLKRWFIPASRLSKRWSWASKRWVLGLETLADGLVLGIKALVDGP